MSVPYQHLMEVDEDTHTNVGALDSINTLYTVVIAASFTASFTACLK